MHGQGKSHSPNPSTPSLRTHQLRAAVSFTAFTAPGRAPRGPAPPPHRAPPLPHSALRHTLPQGPRPPPQARCPARRAARRPRCPRSRRLRRRCSRRRRLDLAAGTPGLAYLSAPAEACQSTGQSAPAGRGRGLGVESGDVVLNGVGWGLFWAPPWPLQNPRPAGGPPTLDKPFTPVGTAPIPALLCTIPPCSQPKKNLQCVQHAQHSRSPLDSLHTPWAHALLLHLTHKHTLAPPMEEDRLLAEAQKHFWPAHLGPIVLLHHSAKVAQAINQPQLQGLAARPCAACAGRRQQRHTFRALALFSGAGGRWNPLLGARPPVARPANGTGLPPVGRSASPAGPELPRAARHRQAVARRPLFRARRGRAGTGGAAPSPPRA